ncbi:Gmad2 immunoglobulin-like domain-containing protein [Desulfofundulus thermosubterraneus]|uniref:Sporulation and spore germination n=1 Tax=Desulfofundulus thermosubterraneus DSM 16057 TaxID=1121432 RepID=A0A1M6BBS1_9FIRM|nr:Gmad2 immunoglobulin-like domain-containing protein [Desulfofundulus thermosubterraneus]SHI45893.1 Sporulation and spore germination [Desulfofundulus thermosubterraneus DSM 16057]
MGKVPILVLSFFILLLFASSCTWSRQQAPANDLPAPTPPQSLLLAVYYVKSTGQESYLVREVHKVPPAKDPALKAVQELISAEPSTPGAIRILPPNTKVLGVTVKDGLATVNFSREVLEHPSAGAEGEALGIQSVVNTLTEFPEIRQVSFQVEGKVDERTRDWWGHVGLYDQPFRRDLSRVYEPAIWVTHPTPDQVVGVPLLVKGSARVYEGTVNARLLDSQGKVLVSAYATATKAAPERGDFEMRLNFTPPQDGKGTLEVFSISAKDGSIENKVTIPVRWP